MAKCWLCKTRKGKRYCAPIENLLCPICCAENRLKKIDCNEECRYLDGVQYQEKRKEEKEFSKLMESVPHGQYNDIFNDIGVAHMAFEIESLVRELYISSEFRITDKTVYEAYKKIYKFHVNELKKEEIQLDKLTEKLLNLYEHNITMWKIGLTSDMIGKVFLRLMISIKNMTGGQFGEFGYLNYLKNNLLNKN